MKDSQQILPPGFRFHPTDQELILHYLKKKLTSSLPLPVSIIAEVDIYKFNPWDLPAMALFGEKEWYFFSPRDRKYPNGVRPNRSAASGYWKATGTDKTINAASPTASGHHRSIGVKKSLVFYIGRPPRGIKTSWIMHEYRLNESSNHKGGALKCSSMRLDNWVLCRIYKKANVCTQTTTTAVNVAQDEAQGNQFGKGAYPPSLNYSPSQNILKDQRSSSLTNLLDAMDYSLLSRCLAEGQGCSSDTDPTLVLNGGVQGQSFTSNYNTSSTVSGFNTQVEEKIVLPELFNSSSSMFESYFK